MSNYENHVQKDLVTDAVFTEANEEFVLPDYMPEIGRVLRLSACLLPDEPFLGTEGAEFSGRLEYRLLYSDGEGALTEAPLEGHYRYRVPYKDTHVSVAYTEELLESAAARPTAPRKLTVRARVTARPHLLTEATVGVPLSTLVGNAPAETKEGRVAVTDRFAVSFGTRRVEGRFAVTDALPEALTLISVRTDPLIESAEARDGYVSVRGKLIACLLLARDGGTPFLQSFSLPFEEELPFEASAEGDAVTLQAFAAAPAVSFEEEGADTAVLLDCEYSLSGVLYRARTLPVIKDLYVHGATHVIERQTFAGEAFLGAAMGNVTVSAEVPLPADQKTEGGCLYPLFRVKEMSERWQGDRAVTEGTLAVSLIAFGEKGNDVTELTFPFRAEISLGTACREGDALRVTVTPVGGTAHAAKDSVRLTTELALCAAAFRPDTVELPVSAIKTQDAPPLDARDITVYYPTDGDTLWTVGKKYALPLSHIKKKNGFPENGEPEEEETDSLDGYAYLLIEGL